MDIHRNGSDLQKFLNFMVPLGAIKNKKKNVVNMAKKVFGRKFGMKFFLVYIPQLWEKQLYFTMVSLFVLSEHTTVTELHPLIRFWKNDLLCGNKSFNNRT